MNRFVEYQVSKFVIIEEKEKVALKEKEDRMFEDIEYFLSQAENKGINVSALRARIATLTRDAMETFVGELQEGPSLSGLIVTKQSEQRVVVGPVTIPGEPDNEGEVLTAKKIETMAYEFLEKYRHVDAEHALKSVGTPVSSDILRFEETYTVDGEELVLPKGTWMLGVRVEDDDTWAAVKSGKMKGFSIMGVPRDKLEAATKEAGVHWENGVLRKTLLSDLGPDWVTVAVSILERPSVTKSMFVAVKEGVTWLDRLRHRLSIKGDANQNEEDERLKDEDKQEVAGMISEAIKAAVPDIVTAVKEAATPKPEVPEEVVLEEAEEVTAFKARVDKLEADNKAHGEGMEKLGEFLESVTKSQGLPSSDDAAPTEDKRFPPIERDLAGRRVK